MKIFTITLNPVYDIFYSVPKLNLREENQASSVSVFTGGKGVNVSRALLGCGFDAIEDFVATCEGSLANRTHRTALVEDDKIVDLGFGCRFLIIVHSCKGFES